MTTRFRSSPRRRPRPQQAGRGAVAEQRRRDEVRDLEVVEPEGERAQFEGDEERGRSGRASSSWAAMVRPQSGRRSRGRRPARAARRREMNGDHVIAQSSPFVAACW